MMVNLESWLKNKKIIVFGLGLHGGGLTLANWLYKQGADVLVTDKKTDQALQQSVKKLIIPQKNIFLGQEPVLSWLDKADLILKNPGVPNDHFFIKAAEKIKIPIYNEAGLFFSMVENPILAITGSKGKSTTTHLLGLICSSYHKNTLVGGNIKINPMFNLINKIDENSKIILELSSWQLEGLKIIKKSPHISLLTNITPEHLNRYKSFSEYVQAKFLIFKYQLPEDIALLNQDDPVSKKLARSIKSEIFWYSRKKIVKRGVYLEKGKIYFKQGRKREFIINRKDIILPGDHNLENILGAILAAKILNIPNKFIVKVVRKYRGFSNRFEVIRKWKGITFINDTTATAPVATIAALKTLSKKSILLAGGSSKDLPVEFLAKIIKKKTKFCFLFSGLGSEQLIKALQKIKYPANKLFINYESMKEIVFAARQYAKSGDIIILSPGFASFANFKNEFDRGDQFNKIVKKLK